MPDLLATKLHRPAVPPRRILRPRLVQRLNEGLEAGRRLTLVSAPAGFGKTTCISEWIQDCRLLIADCRLETNAGAIHLNQQSTINNQQSVWLSLDPSDNDPGRFFACLGAALRQVDAALGSAVEQALALAKPSGPQLPSAEAAGTALVNAIAGYPGRFVLVLDDFHAIQDRFILQVMERLVANLPPPLHLVLLTREDPALPLARLRANNQLTEIRASDLRFTPDEAGRFLNEGMELCLSQADITALEDRTEGWIAGLQLAGLSMRDRADPSHFIATLSGSHRFILSYLTEEVLSRQPEEIQSFLMKTSILERLCAPLCEATIKDKGGRMKDEEDSSDFILHPSSFILDLLERSNLFLIPLDDEGRWYRYHHLFADMLANRLRQALPDGATRDLHWRAGEWLAQNDFYDEAIRHLLAAKDHERVVALVEQNARKMFFTGRLSTLRSWMESLPESCFTAHPRLGVYRTWIDLLQGRFELSEQVLQEKEQLLAALPPSPENDALRLDLLLVLCRFLPLAGDTSRTIRVAREALRALPEADLESRARVHFALGIAHSLEGDPEISWPAYQESERLARAAGAHSLAAHPIKMQAQDRRNYGQLREAARMYQSIVEMGAAPAGQEASYLAGDGWIGLAAISLECNDLETAERCLFQGMDLCRRGQPDELYNGYMVGSRLRQARGDFDGALEEIRQLELAYPRVDDPNKVSRQIQIRLAQGDIESVTRLGRPLLERPTGGLPLGVREFIQVIQARVHLALGETATALQMLDEVLATAGPGGRHGLMIEAYLLMALAQQKTSQGKFPAEAVLSCEQALALAEPEGYVLLFLEAGPELVPLLQAAASRADAPDRLKVYAQKILAACPQGAEAAALPPSGRLPVPSAAGESLVEPLTGRELDVLRLMAGGLTYQEIALRLFISLNTVRTYVKEIYSKLGVDNRTRAIAAAREQNLI